MEKKIGYMWIDDQVEFNHPTKGRLFIDGAPDVESKKIEALDFARKQNNVVTICVQRRNPGTESGFQLVEADRQEKFGEDGYCVGETAIAYPSALAPKVSDIMVHKTGNSANDCSDQLATAHFNEPYPDMPNHKLAEVAENHNIGEFVLSGTQLKRCLLGTAIFLTDEAFSVVILEDASARQKNDYTKTVAEDPVLLDMLQGLHEKGRIESFSPEAAINKQVKETLEELGVKFLNVGQWKSRVKERQLGTDPDRNSRKI